MSAADLLARCEAAGFTISVTDGVPQLVKARDGAKLPAALLEDLKAGRAAVVRHLMVAAVLARAKAAKREAWALTAGEPCAWQLNAGNAGEADWIGVEGEGVWIRVPRGDA